MGKSSNGAVRNSRKAAVKASGLIKEASERSKEPRKKIITKLYEVLSIKSMRLIGGKVHYLVQWRPSVLPSGSKLIHSYPWESIEQDGKTTTVNWAPTWEPAKIIERQVPALAAECKRVQLSAFGHLVE
jgi:hypothetical protein